MGRWDTQGGDGLSRIATTSRRSAEIQGGLGKLLASGAVGPATPAYLTDATEHRGIRGSADAVVLPATAEEVARVVSWCYEHEVPIVPRGGGTGFAGGAVPLDGGVVVAPRADDARCARSSRCCGGSASRRALRTAEVRRLARENGLCFPPDPGAAEQSQIGGNIATNAGGPHAFKYGVTGAWVTGLEAVVPPGEMIAVGGPIRKDVAGYDLKGLLVGSEGTLGVDHRGLAAAAAGARGGAARGRLLRRRRRRAARRSRRCSAAG